MALNFPQQSNNPSTADAKTEFPSVFNRIKKLFASPLTVTVIILVFVMGYLFEWWTVAIASFIGGAILGKSSGETFVKGMVAVIIVWLLMVCYYHFSTQGILSNKIAQILPVGGNVTVLIVVTVLIGGIVGGWAAMSGFLVRNLFRK